MSIEYKTFRLSELKAAEDEPGQFSGYAAVYGNLDRNGDVLDQGAMTRSINNEGGEFPLLWQHDRHTPIGVVKLEDTPRGAKAVGRISLDVPQGMMAYSLLKAPMGFKRGALRSMSIGYIPSKDTIQDGVRHLKEVSIMEVSLVTIPANPKAQVVNVKNVGLETDRISRLELAIAALGEALEKSGLLDGMEEFHALLGSEDLDSLALSDPAMSHSTEHKKLMEEMQRFKEGIFQP